jgi:glutaredoxin
MAELSILYVKSEKVAHVEYSMPHHDHYCDAGYRATSTDLTLGEEDQKAIELLEKAGVKYKLVDLGLARATTRIKAKIERANTTPTLIYKGQKLRGLQQIAARLEKLQALSRNSF